MAQILSRLMLGMWRALLFLMREGSATAVVVVVALVFVDVLLRYIFDRPLAFGNEYAGYLLVVIICWGLGYTQQVKGHINVSIVVNILPQHVTRWLEVATSFLASAYVIVLLIQVARTTAHSFAEGMVMETVMRTPVGYVQLLMPIGIGVFALVLMVQTVEAVRRARFGSA